ncbi:MAG: glycosyltransferase family 2 protein, partial [Clostridia bacterium]|nr:glycosyltransferase family 2 protein [Clostridia bacterium]
MVSSESFMDNDGVRLQGAFIVKEEILYKNILKQNCISCSAVLVKKELLLENPFYADEVHEDYLCWLTILKKIGVAYGVQEALSVRRLTTGSKSRNKFKALKMS